MYILIDLYGYSVICNELYEDLDNARADLDAEFQQFTCEDNDIEYGKYCYQSDDGMYAWAKLHGKYRVWSIIKLS